ncbi:MULTISPECIES: BolA family transcriptional regulator [Gammaproteobacteria]|uniref:BolA family protein n=1 Tax=Gammaproteobacteria TaxID=1236 RepID=UPI000DD09B31|nr:MULTISPECIES: BolA/IbaG family iron-sulfur metabolism protein [Gammaproteobacteria]RTE86042.1 BolA/IbaG family iron-sulfur metabolism protein [Aliidiomarina sp. B3213]TCZ91396.1 BolA/IbaG family iron-sulfur metabolism protein [Lysobacter sp. N42]
MSMKNLIETKLKAQFEPDFLSVEDESYMHASGPDAESHFKAVIVSTEFEGKRLVARHQAVNTVLADELAGSVHALGLHTYTPEEWRARQESARQSPNCLGGGAKG